MPQALVHAVYFTLRDATPTRIEQLVRACHEHLAGHAGERFFAAGPRAPEYERPVNARDFHVALLVVFGDRAAHDAYQVSERHRRFIAEQQEHWATVRVCDSHAAP
jgi:hypothetical protein